MFQARGIQPSGGDGVSYFPVAMIKHHNPGQFKEENVLGGAYDSRKNRVQDGRTGACQQQATGMVA